jgi:hypothetical protein
MPQIRKRLQKYFDNEGKGTEYSGGFSESPSELLKTIKYNNNFLNMKLPRANYEKVSYATLPSGGEKSRSRQQKMQNPNATATITKRGINQGAKLVGKQSQRQQVIKSNQQVGEDEY